MKALKYVFTICLVAMVFVSMAQSVNYRVIEQNPEYYHTRIHGLITMPDLNTVNGLGITAGLFLDNVIPKSPITVRARLTTELLGLANGRLRILKDTTIRRMRTYDIGVKYRIFGGSVKDAYTKVGINSSSKLTGVKAKRITECLGRAGVYRWGYNDFRAMGVSSGISIRDRRHTKIELTRDNEYYYTGESNTEFYADLLFLPINNQPENVEYKANRMGWRVGFMRGTDEFNALFELSSRPSQQQIGFDIYLLMGLTFGVGF